MSPGEDKGVLIVLLSLVWRDKDHWCRRDNATESDRLSRHAPHQTPWLCCEDTACKVSGRKSKFSLYAGQCTSLLHSQFTTPDVCVWVGVRGGGGWGCTGVCVCVCVVGLEGGTSSWTMRNPKQDPSVSWCSLNNTHTVHLAAPIPLNVSHSLYLYCMLCLRETPAGSLQ